MVRVSPISSVTVEVVPDPHVVTSMRDQAPYLADIPVRRISQSGTSNWVFCVGDQFAIRLLRSDDYVTDLVNGVRWLPHLAPHCQLPSQTSLPWRAQ